ncbi:hypothetical protein SEEH1576_04958, partial [Salmonella enterica subsp. enterica serovar Heidelberg str. 41576]
MKIALMMENSQASKNA